MRNRLYVGNLALHVTEAQLVEHVSQYGDAQSVDFVVDRGYAFVEMANADGMNKAISELHGKDFEGRTLTVKIADARRGSRGGGRVRDAEPAVAPHDFLAERASKIGEAWAHEYVHDLQSHDRAPVGAWPGTMSEARRRVVTQLATPLAPERVNELARVANLAAKRGWQAVCEPDLEA